MANPSPYRSLSPEKRVQLVTHVIKASKEGRAIMVQRMMSRGGFRPVTLQSWPAEKLASEIVRMKAETGSDELDLLHLLYVELEPAIQTTFLDAAGVKHDGGKIPEELKSPYADEAGALRGTGALTEDRADRDHAGRGLAVDAGGVEAALGGLDDDLLRLAGAGRVGDRDGGRAAAGVAGSAAGQQRQQAERQGGERSPRPHTGALTRAPAAREPSSTSAGGRSSVKAVKRRLELIVMRPPMRWASSLAIARPSPEPPALSAV